MANPPSIKSTCQYAAHELALGLSIPQKTSVFPTLTETELHPTWKLHFGARREEVECSCTETRAGIKVQCVLPPQ